MNVLINIERNKQTIEVSVEYYRDSDKVDDYGYDKDGKDYELTTAEKYRAVNAIYMGK